MSCPKDGARRDYGAVLGLVTFGLVAVAGCAGLRSEVSTAPASGIPARLGSLDTDADGSLELLTLTRDRAELGVHAIDPQSLAWNSSSIELEAIPDAVAVCPGPAAPALAMAYPTLGVVVLARLESGSAQTTRVLSGMAEPVGLACGDFNRDGFHDIVAVTGGSLPELRVVHGTTAGSFAPANWIPVGPASRSIPQVWLGDVDQSGASAVVFGASTGVLDDPVPDHVRVFRNAAHGNLLDETWYRVRSPTSLTGGRVSADLHSDIVTFGRYGAWLLPGSQHGWLGRPRRVMGGRFVAGALADVDGNGRDDVIGLEPEKNRVSVVRSVGPDQFAPPARFRIGDGAVDLATLEHEGTVVLVTANATSRDYTTIAISTSP